MGTLKVLSVVLLLLGCISPTVPQITPDENQPDENQPDDTTTPPLATSSIPSPQDVTCVTATFLQGLKLESGVGLVVRIFDNKIWLEGVDYSDGYPVHSSTPPPSTTLSTTTTTPPTPPPSDVTPDDRK